jgi:formylglycine-generating enzyme required for sulfatase activity
MGIQANDLDSFYCKVKNENGAEATSKSAKLRFAYKISGDTSRIGGGNGTIAPFPSVYVIRGEDQIFTFTPASGSIIVKVFKGITQVVTTEACTLTNVTAPDSVRVIFYAAPLSMKLISSKDHIFIMGCDSLSYASPKHNVTLTYNFYTDEAPVTQKEYSDRTSVSPWLTSGYSLGDNYPAHSMTWYDAVFYCNQRSKNTGLDTVYIYNNRSGQLQGAADYTAPLVLNNLQIYYNRIGYRLCTEAEWEYSCRGNTTTDYFWGKNYSLDFPSTPADSTEFDTYAWWVNNSGYDLHPVKLKSPNPLGLYEMVGTISIFCNDQTQAFGMVNPLRYTGTDPLINPVGEETSFIGNLISRGSTFFDGAHKLTSAQRGTVLKVNGFYALGIRCVLPEQAINKIISITNN